MPVRPKTAAPAASPISGLLTRSFYSGGFTLPEGKYALTFIVGFEKQKEGANYAARLGVHITAHPLSGGEPMEQFLSMGSTAAKSFAPDPETQKTVVAIPGAVGGTLNNKANWFIFLNSLFECGMPELKGGFEEIDGIHVHTGLVPEPEDRKGFGAKTGEAAQEKEDQKPRQGGMIPVVIEILDSGKPWEGTGGVPDETAAPAAPTKVVGKIAPKTAPAAPAAPAAAPAGDEDVLAAAGNGMSAVLGKLKAKETISLLKLKTSTFREVNAAAGGEMGQRVQTEIFGNSDVTNSVLGELGYKLEGGIVSEAQ